ncbi:hypothetical protein [Bradyrhizobium sediminis]|nr:hypothetical protein [Bradyrhizobium sediminis]
MRNWTERTGVYDDICYLRQAHLFQRFGLGGFDTNITRDDDQYFATLAREIGYQAWNDPAHMPCHTQIGEKQVLQYPPGTGLALSIFPAGFQRVPLYGVANFIIFIGALFAIWSAPSRRWTAISGIVGVAALYFMVNPSKASSSIAPTMIVCVMVGYLTSILANVPRPSRQITVTVLIGLILGLAVSFRLANLFLSAGYFLVLLAMAVRSRKQSDILQLFSFGTAYLLGLVPTLVANAINAGSVLATTYSSFDARPPDFSLSVAREYLVDMQGPLIILTAAWSIWAFSSAARKTAAFIVVANIAINLAFFLTHPIFTPYYLMPLAMLSIWTLLFSLLNDSSEAAPLPGQSAFARVQSK